MAVMNFTLHCLTNTQCSQKSNLLVLLPPCKPHLLNSYKPLSLKWPKCIFHKCVEVASLSSDVETAAPVTVSLARWYKFSTLLPFIKTMAPWITFRTPFCCTILQPLESRAPVERTRIVGKGGFPKTRENLILYYLWNLLADMLL